ncbi:hypothetical protein SPRG_12098 [Saprolegnia parasitica CBS 223.65]|uniref:Ion transport domain-containing protein n=1 Tax=Saprolegnia parasitica (strain CBS 223.65) TaxID=695850 RepID=A0A067BZJ0_SAPPC|nr:hypothetical protein SPRG_12098 [Saprolegnia parasitica CBS 223.65]KDO22260.1 hypothetical protein SPRG_12098 [Saprolegnia parasitica CBS 223.65]|eukprot:XP_012206996.1 hypothetical protein SPRG_12098 [Saprolegnia parasitica CBS 223.65]
MALEVSGGEQSLIQASRNGDFAVVQARLLQPEVDPSATDRDHKTALDHAIESRRYDCEALLRNDAFLRATCPEYKAKHVVALQTAYAHRKQVLDPVLFGRALRLEPGLALQMLDNCYRTDASHVLQFNGMLELFGNDDADTSALDEIVRCEDADARSLCLEHVVIRRLLAIKWDIVGERIFWKTLLMFALMLFAMVVATASNYYYMSSISRALDNIPCLDNQSGFNKTTIREFRRNNSQCYTDYTNEREALQGEFRDSMYTLTTVWITGCFLVLFSLAALQWLHPDRLWRVALWVHLGVWPSDDAELQKLHDNDMSLYKAAAKRYLVRCVLVATAIASAATASPVVQYANLGDLFTAMVAVPAIVLWLCAGYFLGVEYGVVLSYDRDHPKLFCQATSRSQYLRRWLYVYTVLPFCAPFRVRFRPYFNSFMNLFRLSTCFLILCVHVPIGFVSVFNVEETPIDELEDGADAAYVAYVYSGVVIFLSLWLQVARFFQVHATAGYLVVTLRSVLGDVANFFAFFGVFELGLTGAYYLIYQCTNNTEIPDMWTTFYKSYFILFGETDEAAFSALRNTTRTTRNSTSAVRALELPLSLHIYGISLRMFHCAIVTMVLLNLLLAMMNKTVDRHCDTARTRGLLAYADMVLSFEKMAGVPRSQLVYIGRHHINPVFAETPFVHELVVDVPAPRDATSLRATRSAMELKASGKVAPVPGTTDLDDMDAQLDALLSRSR